MSFTNLSFAHLKSAAALLLLLAAASVRPALAQDQTHEWQPANDEAVKLDPSEFHTGRVYRPGSNGGSLHVDIEAQHPVTIEMAGADEWTWAVNHPEAPEAMNNMRFMCQREHVVKTTYTCELEPDHQMVLIIRDERVSEHATVLARLGDMVTVRAGVPRRYVSPNDVHIQYYRWACLTNCFPPQFRWFSQVKEKYDLTPILKVYGGLNPDHDGEQVSVKIKAPIPMAVAVLPSSAADQLHASPESLETIFAQTNCKQRGIQSLQFQCPINASDGPQSLVIVPEPGTTVPHKKAEVEMLATKCVANCSEGDK